MPRAVLGSGIYVAHRRRERDRTAIYGQLSAKTKELIEEDYAGKLDALPTPADKEAAIEAMLTADVSEDEPSFAYRLLGERFQRIKGDKRRTTGPHPTACANLKTSRARPRQ